MNYDKELAKIFKIAGLKLNEEIVYAELDKQDPEEILAIVLKNPTRKELKDNLLFNARVICDSDDNWYFCSDYSYIHEQYVDILSTKGIEAYSLSMFYDYKSNLFYARDDYDPETKEQYIKDGYEMLNNDPYIVKNFPNFEYDIFEDESYY